MVDPKGTHASPDLPSRLRHSLELLATHWHLLVSIFPRIIFALSTSRRRHCRWHLGLTDKLYPFIISSFFRTISLEPVHRGALPLQSHSYKRSSHRKKVFNQGLTVGLGCHSTTKVLNSRDILQLDGFSRPYSRPSTFAQHWVLYTSIKGFRN